MPQRDAPDMVTVQVHPRNRATSPVLAAELLGLLESHGGTLRFVADSVDPLLVGEGPAGPGDTGSDAPGTWCWVAVAHLPPGRTDALREDLAHLASRWGLPSLWFAVSPAREFLVRARPGGPAPT